LARQSRRAGYVTDLDRAAVFVDASYVFAEGSKLIAGQKLPRVELLLEYDDCASIPAMGGSTSLNRAFESNGEHAIDHELIVAGTTHRLSYAVTVASYDPQPGGLGCAFRAFAR
jgi:hypothetical protein